jgi:hypothetical protein
LRIGLGADDGLTTAPRGAAAIPAPAWLPIARALPARLWEHHEINMEDFQE